MNKVVFIIPNLNPGGAEKVVSYIAQNVNASLFKSELWIIGSKGEHDFSVHGIECRYLNIKRARNSFFKLIKLIAKHKPDIVFSSITNLNILMGGVSIFFKKTKFIGREANILSIKSDIENQKSSFHKLIFLFFIRKLDLIVCQSQDMYNDLVENYNLPKSKLKIVNNPLRKSSLANISQNFDSNEKKVLKLITVGSFKKQKGHLRIIEALAKLKNIDFEYTLVGDGYERHKIFNLVDQLNLSNKVKHLPYLQDVEGELVKNHLFLQGSFVEGFPNCLLESCSVGLPIVAFDAPGGLNEIIDDGFNGFRCINETQFLEALEKSKNLKWDRTAIRNDIYNRYSSEKILKKYEDLFVGILEN